MKYLLLLVVILFSCKQSHIHSGAGITYFIHGRLRDAELTKSVPFKVKVLYLDKSFYEQKITLQVIDGKSFQISYSDSDKIQHQMGDFGGEVKNARMDLQIYDNTKFKDRIDMFKDFPYQFIVHDSSRNSQ